MEIRFMVSSDLRILSCDKECESIFVRSGSEVKGKPYFFFMPRITEQDRDAVEEAIKNGKEREIEMTFRCLYGDLKARVSIKPRIRENSIEAAEVTIRPEQYCSFYKIFGRFDECSTELKNAFNIVHSIRNHLNAISGAFTYIKSKYTFDSNIQDFFKIIDEEMSSLNQLISKFLVSCGQSLQMYKTDLTQLLNRIQLITSFQVREKNIKTTFQCHNPGPVVIDAFHMEQAILNVINNSIEAMPEGGTLSVKAYNKKIDDKEFAVIEISDTGKGIDMKKIVNSSRKTRERGFGLEITDEILKLHGGFCEIKTGPSKGTTVKLYVPATMETVSE